jgi:hypothetical protein
MRKLFKKYFTLMSALGVWLVPPFVLVGCHPAALVVPSYIQSVGVDVVKNQTSYFGMDTILTQALIRQFQMDGRLPLEDPDKADLKVQIVLRQYNEEPQFFDPKTNYVLQYRIYFVYDLAAVDEREKKTFVEDTGKIHSFYYYTPQYTGAPSETKDQAISQLADDMSHTIVRRVLEGY